MGKLGCKIQFSVDCSFYVGIRMIIHWAMNRIDTGDKCMSKLLLSNWRWRLTQADLEGLAGVDVFIRGVRGVRI